MYFLVYSFPDNWDYMNNQQVNKVLVNPYSAEYNKILASYNNNGLLIFRAAVNVSFIFD